MAFPTTNYLVNKNGANAAKLNLSTAGILNGDVTIEYLAMYRPVLIADASKSTASELVYYTKADGTLLSAWEQGGNAAIPSSVPTGQPGGDAIGHF